MPTATFFQSPPGVQNSVVYLSTGNGVGDASHTVVRRYSTTITNTGTDISYLDDANNGATFTINTTGIYSILVVDASSASSITMGISVNSNQLTTGIASITSANALSFADSGAANLRGFCSWVGRLNAGDVVRSHTGATAANSASASTSRFRIERVGNV